MKTIRIVVLALPALILCGILSNAARAYSRTSTTLVFGTSDQGTGQAAANVTALTTFIADLNGQTSSTPKSIYFADAGNYFFEYSGDQLPAFSNVANLTISGTSSYTWAFDVHVSWHSSATNPQSFLLFGESCSNVEIKDLLFTTTYTSTKSSGSHVKIAGANFNIHGNKFTACPGFALQFISLFGGTMTANHSVTSNRFEETFADGVHVSTGNNINIAGNLFMKTGDDAVAIIADAYDPSASGWTASRPYAITVAGNIIDHSYSRGVLIASCDDVWVENNIIRGTASHGIEINTVVNPDGAAPSNFYLRANYAHINNNAIAGAGAVQTHLYHTGLPHVYLSNRAAIYSSSAANLSINLASRASGGGGVAPGYAVVGYPPSYALDYYSSSCNYYGVYAKNTMYGVIDNLLNVSGTASGATNATIPSSGTVDGAGNNGLTLHNYYGY